MIRAPSLRIPCYATAPGPDFRAAVEADPEIRAVLKPEQIGEAFSLERQLRNVDKIFARVFGE